MNLSTLDRPPRLPLNTFGIAFGTAGLAASWTTASATLDAPSWIGEVLWFAAAAAWAVTIIRYLRRPGGLGSVLTDLRHPVLGPFAALVPVVGALLSAHLAAVSPGVARVGVWAMTILITAFGAWFISALFTQPRDASAVHGGYLLPTVAGSLLAAQSLAAVGDTRIAVGYFAAGVLFWILIGAAILARLMTGPELAGPLLPTLAILSAPPAVAGNAWWGITGGAPSQVHGLLAGVMVALLLPQLFLIRRYVGSGFAIGFWAMTFTTAASATYGLRLLRVDGASPWWSWLVLAVATLIVGTIAVSSVTLTALRARQTHPTSTFAARTR